MEKPRYTAAWRVTAVLYVIASFATGGYVLFTGGPAARGAGGFAGALFLLVFPLLRRIFRLKKVPLMDAVLTVFLFLAFDLGTVLGLYSYIWWMDLAAHGLSGFLFTMVGLCLYWMIREEKRASMGKDALAAASYAFFFSSFIAALWEIFEYVAFLVTGHDSQNVAATGVGDTMEDIMICLAGSLVMAALIYLHLKGKHRSFLLLPAEEFYRANYGLEGDGGRG